MKCHHALEMLEAVAQSDSAEMADPELTVAAAHLQVCPRCQNVVNNRQDIDRVIGAACRDVCVPAGLEDRLTSTLRAESAPQADSANETQPMSSRQPISSQQLISARRPISSRQLGKTLVTLSAASLLCLIAGWWFFAPPSTVTTTELASAAVEGLVSSQSPKRFQGSFDPDVLFPEESIRAAAFKMTRYRQLTISGSTAEIALSSFSFSNRRGRAIRGALLIVPASDVRPRPGASHLSAAATVYQRGFSIKLWQSDGFVYACLVEGDAARFRSIQRNNGGRTT